MEFSPLKPINFDWSEEVEQAQAQGQQVQVQDQAQQLQENQNQQLQFMSMFEDRLQALENRVRFNQGNMQEANTTFTTFHAEVKNHLQKAHSATEQAAVTAANASADAMTTQESVGKLQSVLTDADKNFTSLERRVQVVERQGEETNKQVDESFKRVISDWKAELAQFKTVLDDVKPKQEDWEALIGQHVAMAQGESNKKMTFLEGKFSELLEGFETQLEKSLKSAQDEIFDRVEKSKTSVKNEIFDQIRAGKSKTSVKYGILEADDDVEDFEIPDRPNLHSQDSDDFQGSDSDLESANEREDNERKREDNERTQADTSGKNVENLLERLLDRLSGAVRPQNNPSPTGGKFKWNELSWAMPVFSGKSGEWKEYQERLERWLNTVGKDEVPKAEQCKIPGKIFEEALIKSQDLITGEIGKDKIVDYLKQSGAVEKVLAIVNRKIVGKSQSQAAQAEQQFENYRQQSDQSHEAYVDGFFARYREAKRLGTFTLSDDRRGKKLLDRARLTDAQRAAIDIALIQDASKKGLPAGEKNYDIDTIETFLRGVSTGGDVNAGHYASGDFHNFNRSNSFRNQNFNRNSNFNRNPNGNSNFRTQTFNRNPNSNGNTNFRNSNSNGWNPNFRSPNSNGNSNSAGNSNGSKLACGYCGKPGHATQACNLRKRDFAKGYRCKLCGQNGHRPYGCHKLCSICRKPGHSAKSHRANSKNVFHAEIDSEVVNFCPEATANNATSVYEQMFCGGAIQILTGFHSATPETLTGYGIGDTGCNTDGIIGRQELQRLQKLYKSRGLPDPIVTEAEEAEYSGIGAAKTQQKVTILAMLENLIFDLTLDVTGDSTPILLGNATMDRLGISILRPGHGRFSLNNRVLNRDDEFRADTNARYRIHNNLPYLKLIPEPTVDWQRIQFLTKSGDRRRAIVPEFLKKNKKVAAVSESEVGAVPKVENGNSQ